jgi:ketosteroid isomerase-like protein
MGHPNQELISAAYDAFGRGDVEALGATWTDDVAWHLAGTHQLAGEHEGRDAVMAFLGRILEITGGTFRVELQNAHADDHSGYSLHKSTATRDGATIESWTVLGYRFTDGRVSQIWTFPYDQALENRLFA